MLTFIMIKITLLLWLLIYYIQAETRVEFRSSPSAQASKYHHNSDTIRSNSHLETCNETWCECGTFPEDNFKLSDIEHGTIITDIDHESENVMSPLTNNSSVYGPMYQLRNERFDRTILGAENH
eukprot:8561_1